jgi:accessory colonization factor AcfD
MQSTGLYAPAHEDITVTLPSGVTAGKMQLIIGVGDNVVGRFFHETNLKRPPKYIKKYKFTSNEITVQHPYGGLIYLRSFASDATNEATASIQFTNVQKAVRFVLNTTTEGQWNTIKGSPAPKAELESKHYIITVPRGNMASLSFNEVETIAKNYDKMAKNAYDFYGYDRDCGDTFTEHTPPTCDNNKKLAHKNRVVFDPQISIGDAHSGYPIMFMQWNPTATQFPQNPINDFLLWHEAGHNMVESWLAVEGAGEVANNVMALYQQKSFKQTLYTSQSLGMVGTILDKDIPWADGGDFGKLIMYHQLVGWIDTNYLTNFKAKNKKYYEDNGNVKSKYPFLKGDGFDIYKILHREARDTAITNDKYDVCMKQNG